MTIQELFIRSNEELKLVIEQITDDQWGLVMPAGTTMKPASLVETINYHTYDDAWVPDVLAGKTKDEVGDAYEEYLTTDKSEVIHVYDENNARAIEAVRGIDDLDKQVHLSYGDFSAHDYLQHIISFRAVRIYDIAKLIGAETNIPDDLVEALQHEYEPVIDGYRKMGVFPAAKTVADDADPQTRLLAMFGRD